jgi:hypothetical protein
MSLQNEGGPGSPAHLCKFGDEYWVVVGLEGGSVLGHKLAFHQNIHINIISRSIVEVKCVLKMMERERESQKSKRVFSANDSTNPKRIRS